MFKRDALIIVPPFASLTRPSLGVHILQSCAKDNGFDISILYSNIIFASEIGVKNYEIICANMDGSLIGERIFAPFAYGTVLEKEFSLTDFEQICICQSNKNLKNNISDEMFELKLLEFKAIKWIDSISQAVTKYNINIIGLTSTFQQNAASIALLKRIKYYNPNIITILGGSNCQGIMAEGILSLSNAIDYIFSGESETSFIKFLRNINENKPMHSRIFYGTPCTNLDTIPTPDFSNFYDQINAWIPNSNVISNDRIWLPYESSRGCWWGQKSHCTFCGIDKDVIKFRKKVS